MLGIPRPDNARDVDWAREVPTLQATTTTLPPPVQISVSDLLAGLKRPKPTNPLLASSSAAVAAETGSPGNAKVRGQEKRRASALQHYLVKFGKEARALCSITVDDQGPRFAISKRNEKPISLVLLLRSLQVVCYYASWSARRPGLGRFSPEDVNAQMCTHLVYAFGSLKDNRLALVDDNDELSDQDVGVYDRLQALRSKVDTNSQ